MVALTVSEIPWCLILPLFKLNMQIQDNKKKGKDYIPHSIEKHVLCWFFGKICRVVAN